MSDVIRISLGDHRLISDYREARLSYLKSHFNDDPFYSMEYDSVSKMGEKELLFDALNQAFCDYKYKINYSED